MRGFWVLLLLAMAVDTANADWLAQVSPDNAAPKWGIPAITFSGDGNVTVVLPEAALGEAHAEGLSTEGAIGAFLARYAPNMCSTPLDMSVPHPNLKVDLLIQHPAALEDINRAGQADAAAMLNHAMKTIGRGPVPRIDKVFIVDQEPLSLSIDYVPEQKSHCLERPNVIF